MKKCNKDEMNDILNRVEQIREDRDSENLLEQDFDSILRITHPELVDVDYSAMSRKELMDHFGFSEKEVNNEKA
jgi:predicted DNA binding CopG/RHH family protein